MRPEAWPLARSICVTSPVTTALEPKPMRVRNIFICSGVVFCASSRITNEWLSVRPRMKASGAISMAPRSKSARHLVVAHEVVERVVERAQVRVDLLREVAGQEAQLLARLHRRAREHDALHRVALEAHRPPRPPRGTSCPVPAGPMPNVMSSERICCRYCAWRGVRAVRSPRRGSTSGGDSISRAGARVADLDQAQLDVLDGEVARGLVVEAPQRLRGELRLLGRPGDAEALAAPRDGHVERVLDLAQVRVERAAQRREPGVVDRREGDVLRRWLRQSRDAKSLDRVRPALRGAQTPARCIGAFSASSSVLRLSARCARVSFENPGLACAARISRGELLRVHALQAARIGRRVPAGREQRAGHAAQVLALQVAAHRRDLARRSSARSRSRPAACRRARRA